MAELCAFGTVLSRVCENYDAWYMVLQGSRANKVSCLVSSSSGFSTVVHFFGISIRLSNVLKPLYRLVLVICLDDSHNNHSVSLLEWTHLRKWVSFYPMGKIVTDNMYVLVSMLSD